MTQQTRVKGGFEGSFTDTGGGEKYKSSERTSTFFHMRKFGDSKLRAIETRGAEQVGLSSANVEPLQVVAYRDGQQFTAHHDAGTMCDGDEVRPLYPFVF